MSDQHQQASGNQLFVERVEPDTTGIGAYYWAITGENVSSAAKDVESFVKKNIPDLDSSRGIIWTQPHQRLLMVRDVTKGDHLFNGIGIMAPFSARQYDRKPDPVSAQVFLRRDGKDIPVTEPTAKGKGLLNLSFVIRQGGPLADLLGWDA